MPHGLLGKLGSAGRTLFGGQNDPRLSEEQNRAASSDALVTSGLATLTAPSVGGFAPTALQAIATGAFAGREQGAASREDLRLRDQQAQIQELVDSGAATPEMLQSVFLQAIANGDTDSARALAEVIKSVGTGRRGALRTQVVTLGDRQKLIDLNTGEEIADLGESAGKTKPTIRFFDDEQGRMVIHNRNPDGTPGLFLAFADSGRQSNADALSNGLAGNIADAAAGLDGIDAELTRLLPNLAARSGPILGGAANWLLGAEVSPFRNPAAQKAVTDGLVFISFAVRHLSGAQMTEQETRRYHRALLPVFGDGPETIVLKRRKRAIMANAMASGRWKAFEDEQGNWIFPSVAETLGTIEREARQAEGILDTAGGVDSSAADQLRN